MTKIRDTSSSRVTDNRAATKAAAQTRASNQVRSTQSKQRNQPKTPGLYPAGSKKVTPNRTFNNGQWRDRNGTVIGTGPTEDSPISRVKPKTTQKPTPGKGR